MVRAIRLDHRRRQRRAAPAKSEAEAEPVVELFTDDAAPSQASWRGAALASAVIAFPLMVRAIRLALEAVDIRLEQAARAPRVRAACSSRISTASSASRMARTISGNAITADASARHPAGAGGG
jgi:hypothetical protein